jgi:hypothetical protein
VYKYLEKKFGLVRDEILRSPETFSMGLVSLFGSASKQLEVAIIRRFHDKLGIKFESSETFNFVDCVATLLT